MLYHKVWRPEVIVQNSPTPPYTVSELSVKRQGRGRPTERGKEVRIFDSSTIFSRFCFRIIISILFFVPVLPSRPDCSTSRLRGRVSPGDALTHSLIWLHSFRIHVPGGRELLGGDKDNQSHCELRLQTALVSLGWPTLLPDTRGLLSCLVAYC